MSSEVVLRVENAGKRYEMYEAPHHRLLQAIHRGRKQFYREFWALRDVSLKVKQGECIGIIGRNGCGKSTLLQVIAGILDPTTGAVEAQGKIAALLELGSGFNPEFTGRENAFMNGTLLGLSKTEMEEGIDAVEDFADIGNFFDQPVKTYSSGMYVRLAFASAISVDPDILVIDEALAVGDIRFQQKCFRKLKEFRDQRKTILFVSHDLSAVKMLCDRAVWLDHGQVQCEGDPDQVTKKYFSFMTYGLESDLRKTARETGKDIIAERVPSQAIEWESAEDCESFGEKGAVIEATALYSKTRGGKIAAFEGGEDVVFCVKIDVKQRIEFPLLGFILKDKRGTHLLGYTSHHAGVDAPPFEPGKTKVVCFEFRFPRLMSGTYLFSPAIADGTMLAHTQHHWVHDAYVVQVVSKDEIANIGNYFIPETAAFSIKDA